MYNDINLCLISGTKAPLYGLRVVEFLVGKENVKNYVVTDDGLPALKSTRLPLPFDKVLILKGI